MSGRHLTVATAIEKNRLFSDVTFLICLEITVKNQWTGDEVEKIRLVNNNDDILFDGNVYSKANFEIDVSQEAGGTPEITLVAQDQTRALQAKMQAYDGGVGSEVRLMIVNAAALDQPPEIEEKLLVIGASARDYVATFNLGAENPLNMRFPRRRQFRDRCPWKYRGNECGYVGTEPTCDYTLQGANGCATHGNAARFGGFPGIRKSQR